MNIVVDISNEPVANVGDIAMAAVAIQRLGEIAPQAKIHVISTEPERCAAIFPDVTTISGRAHKSTSTTGSLIGRLTRLAPTLESSLRRRWPHLTSWLITQKRAIRGGTRVDVRPYFEVIRSADLVVVPGGGWVTDAFDVSSRLVLKRWHWRRSMVAPQRS